MTHGLKVKQCDGKKKSPPWSNDRSFCLFLCLGFFCCLFFNKLFLTKWRWTQAKLLTNHPIVSIIVYRPLLPDPDDSWIVWACRNTPFITEPRCDWLIYDQHWSCRNPLAMSYAVRWEMHKRWRRYRKGECAVPIGWL